MKEIVFILIDPYKKEARHTVKGHTGKHQGCSGGRVCGKNNWLNNSSGLWAIRVVPSCPVPDPGMLYGRCIVFWSAGAQSKEADGVWTLDLLAFIAKVCWQTIHLLSPGTNNPGRGTSFLGPQGPQMSKHQSIREKKNMIDTQGDKVDTVACSHESSKFHLALYSHIPRSFSKSLKLTPVGSLAYFLKPKPHNFLSRPLTTLFHGK